MQERIKGLVLVACSKFPLPKHKGVNVKVSALSMAVVDEWERGDIMVNVVV